MPGTETLRVGFETVQSEPERGMTFCEVTCGRSREVVTKAERKPLRSANNEECMVETTFVPTYTIAKINVFFNNAEACHAHRDRMEPLYTYHCIVVPTSVSSSASPSVVTLNRDTAVLDASLPFDPSNDVNSVCGVSGGPKRARRVVLLAA